MQQAPRRVSMHADGKHWQPRAGAAFARAGLSRRRGLPRKTHRLRPASGQAARTGFSGHARVIMSWVWVSLRLFGPGVLQVSAGGAQIVSACEKLYSSIAVSKRGLAPEWRGGSTSSGPIPAGSVTFRIVVFFYRRPRRSSPLPVSVSSSVSVYVPLTLSQYVYITVPFALFSKFESLRCRASASG